MNDTNDKNAAAYKAAMTFLAESRKAGKLREPDESTHIGRQYWINRLRYTVDRFAKGLRK